MRAVKTEASKYKGKFFCTDNVRGTHVDNDLLLLFLSFLARFVPGSVLFGPLRRPKERGGGGQSSHLRPASFPLPLLRRHTLDLGLSD